MQPAENATVMVCQDPAEAEVALRELQAAGFEAGAVSVAARQPGDQVVCCYRAGGAMRYRGGSGSFWNHAWEALPGGAILGLPGDGGLLVAGRLAEWVVGALDHAAIFSGLTAFGAALYSIGVSKEAIAEYEAALAGGRYLVIAHGPAGEVARAKQLLRGRSLG